MKPVVFMQSTTPTPTVFATITIHVRTSSIFLNKNSTFWAIIYLKTMCPVFKLFVISFLTIACPMIWLVTTNTRVLFAFCTRNFIFLCSCFVQNSFTIWSRAKYQMRILSNECVIWKFDKFFKTIFSNNKLNFFNRRNNCTWYLWTS